MTQSKHTPGPWVIDDRPSHVAGRGLEVEPVHKGACIADVPTAFSSHGIHAPATIGQPCPSVDDMNAQGLANANLIAAAPELLAALGALLDWAQCDLNYVPQNLEGLAEQAIAKAEGRA